MSHVMIDLETLSTAPNASVLSIGAAAFDDEKVADTIGVRIDPYEVFGDISVDTVRWWVNQQNNAKSYSFNGNTPQYVAYTTIKGFFAKHFDKNSELWANSPSFDCVIFNSWIAGLRERHIAPFRDEPLWHFRQQRDLRTLLATARMLGCDTGRLMPLWSGTAHNPVDDAANQARTVIAVRKWLANATRPFARSSAPLSIGPGGSQDPLAGPTTACPQPVVMPTPPIPPGTIKC